MLEWTLSSIRTAVNFQLRLGHLHLVSQLGLTECIENQLRIAWLVDQLRRDYQAGGRGLKKAKELVLKHLELLWSSE
jgi:hypothetical protein